MTAKEIGTAITVGGLRKLLKPYSDNTSFGFRNQPMQILYEVKSKKLVYIVFQK